MDLVRDVRSTTAIVAAATSVIGVYAALTTDQPDRPLLLAAVGVALTIHLSLWLFTTQRVARWARYGSGGIVFLLACFAFAAVWVALDGGSASPLNTMFLVPLVVAVLRAPSRAWVVLGLATGFHLLGAADAGALEPATSLVWITQFVLLTVGPARIANLRSAQRRRLREVSRELEELAVRDPLTGVLNRRGFAAALDRLAADPSAGLPSALMVADLDHFKRINDAHGHAAGDQVLVSTAAAIGTAIRDADVVARTGGEEFAIVLLDADTAEIGVIAERVRRAIAGCSVDLPVTASVGVAVTGAETDLERLHVLADRAMYRAKELGRDRVVIGPDGSDRAPAAGSDHAPVTAPTTRR